MEFIFWFIVIVLILGFFGSRTNSTITSNNDKVKPKKDSDLLDLLSKKYNDTKEKIDSKLHELVEREREFLESYKEKRNNEYESFGITKKDREPNYIDEKFFEKEYTPKQLENLKKVTKFISDLTGIEELAKEYDTKTEKSSKESAVITVRDLLANINRTVDALREPVNEKDGFQNRLFQDESHENKSIVILKKHHIDRIYHVTSINNWMNIKNAGGLYSWAYLQNNNMSVDYISNDLSRSLDIRANTQDFIKLSFRKITPMTFGKVKSGKRLILLSINVIKLLENINNDDIYFCPINSTDNEAKIYNISNTDELSQLRFDLLNNKRWYQKGSYEYKASQAEILVKRFIPFDLINFEYELTQNDL